MAVNTTLSAGAGAAAAEAISKMRYDKTDLGLTINGALAGLVAITLPAGFVDPYAAVIIGLIGDVVVVFSVAMLDKLHIDDPVGAISVHGVVGVWGILAVGLFATQRLVGGDDYGLLVGGGIEQLGVQVVGSVAVAAWTMVLSGLLFLGIKHTIGLRVSGAEELSGLDVQEHGIGSYPEFGTVIPGAAVETDASGN